MMKKYLLPFVLSLLCTPFVNAQRSIVESLQAHRPGEGSVTIHQDTSITSLIGLRYAGNAVAGVSKTLKARGFRVQVYAGNNSRVARNEATSIAEKVKEKFPDMPVYTYFQPPRWLCRIGDFRSIEEAHVAMRLLKDSGEFKEVAIVREQINIPLE